MNCIYSKINNIYSVYKTSYIKFLYIYLIIKCVIDTYLKNIEINRPMPSNGMR